MKRLWVVPVVLVLCLVGYSYFIHSSKGDNGGLVDVIMADISYQMLNYLMLNSIERVYLGDEHNFENMVCVAYARGDEFFPDQLEELTPDLDADCQVIFLSIGNESRQTIAQEPLPRNVTMITQDRKAVSALDLKELRQDQPLYSQMRSLITHHYEYFGGLRRRPVLPGEYSICIYVFPTSKTPYQIVVRDWLPQDVVMRHDSVKRSFESASRYVSGDYADLVSVADHHMDILGDYIHVSGHVKNLSDKELVFVTITIYFLDKEGKPMQKALHVFPSIVPNFVEGFSVLKAIEDIPNWSGDYEIEVTASLASRN